MPVAKKEFETYKNQVETALHDLRDQWRKEFAAQITNINRRLDELDANKIGPLLSGYAPSRTVLRKSACFVLGEAHVTAIGGGNHPAARQTIRNAFHIIHYPLPGATPVSSATARI